jgi:hypothetical protein
MKATHTIIGILFALFALVQCNDPDFYIWIPAYGLISFLAFSKVFGRSNRKLAFFAAIVFGIWCLTYLPALIDWIQMGMPNIAGSMKAEEPHIELVREFGGLLICMPVVVYYAFLGK